MKKKKGRKLGVFNSGLTQRQKRRLIKKNKINTEIILVCATKGKKCDENGFHATVGNEEHLFCCENGFVQSLEDFKKTNKMKRLIFNLIILPLGNSLWREYTKNR